MLAQCTLAVKLVVEALWVSEKSLPGGTRGGGRPLKRRSRSRIMGQWMIWYLPSEQTRAPRTGLSRIWPRPPEANEPVYMPTETARCAVVAASQGPIP